MPGKSALTSKLRTTSSELRQIASGQLYRFCLIFVAACSILQSLPARGQIDERIAAYLPLCHSCHGENGVSTNPEVPSLAGQHEAFLSQSIKGYQSSNSVSEAMRSIVAPLKDDEIFRLANHFAAQPYVRNRQAVDPAKAAKGKEVYLRLCQICHRDEGRSSSYAEYPLLAGQSLDYLRLTMGRILGGQKKVDILKTEMLSLASPDRIDQAIHFFASQEVDPSQVTTTMRNHGKRRRFMTSQ